MIVQLYAHGKTSRASSCAFFWRMRVISWLRFLFWCVAYGLRSSRTYVFIDGSDSLPRVREKAV